MHYKIYCGTTRRDIGSGELHSSAVGLPWRDIDGLAQEFVMMQVSTVAHKHYVPYCGSCQALFCQQHVQKEICKGNAGPLMTVQ